MFYRNPKTAEHFEKKTTFFSLCCETVSMVTAYVTRSCNYLTYFHFYLTFVVRFHPDPGLHHRDTGWVYSGELRSGRAQWTEVLPDSPHGADGQTRGNLETAGICSLGT